MCKIISTGCAFLSVTRRGVVDRYQVGSTCKQDAAIRRRRDVTRPARAGRACDRAQLGAAAALGRRADADNPPACGPIKLVQLHTRKKGIQNPTSNEDLSKQLSALKDS